MEPRKFSRPNSEDDKHGEKYGTFTKRTSSWSAKGKRLGSKDVCRSITPPSKYSSPSKSKWDSSRTSVAEDRLKQENSITSCSSSFQEDIRTNNHNEKPRLIESKGKSTADYNEKIHDLNRKSYEIQKFESSKIPRAAVSSTSSFSRQLAADSLQSSQKDVKTDLLTNFEKNVQQISEIWLKTSLDLSNILNNLKNSLPPDSSQFQAENSRIQLAIKQAKSLTLIKTKNVIAEAKKLLHAQEVIQTRLENLVNNENYSEDEYKRQASQDGKRGKQKTGERGDSKKPLSSGSQQKKSRDRSLSKDGEKGNCSGEVTVKKSRTNNSMPVKNPPTINVKSLLAEVEKKNGTITYLNNKLFEFQKACNEHLLENSQLQAKITELNEKAQWNQVLWKQITKLKERIKILQQANKQLEGQKKELEQKIAGVNQESDKVTRLYNLFKQQKNMWHSHDRQNAREELISSSRSSHRKIRNESHADKTLSSTTSSPVTPTTADRDLQEKENIIEELKNILVLMRSQETVAHQQITEFETKMEEFRKNQNT